MQADIDLHDKAAVDAEDRKRFAFVNSIVDEVETRRTASSETTKADKLDSVLTNPVAGIIIFAAVMWCVFAISQTYLGTWIADWLVGWIETFQEFVGGAMENSPALLSTINFHETETGKRKRENGNGKTETETGKIKNRRKRRCCSFLASATAPFPGI